MPATVTASSTVALVTSVQSCYDFDFTQRLYLVTARVCLEVLAESSGDYTDHASRVAFARQVLSNPSLYVDQSIRWAVAADQATRGPSSDQDLFDRVLSIWSKLSVGH